jgi:hypothetical protein
MPAYVWEDANVPLLPGRPGAPVRSAMQNVKRALFVDTAQGADLTTIGDNYGVPRPAQVVSDALYARLLQVLAFLPKTTLATLYRLLTAVFGSQDAFTAVNTRPWRIYEVNPNEYIIELPLALLAATNETASYLHGWSGYASVTVAGDTFTTPGDLGIEVGSLLHVLNGTWVSHSVATRTYNAGTNLTTVTVTAPSLPLGGGLFYAEVPGDGLMSYRGDFLATGGFVGTYTTLPGPPTATLSVQGDAVPHVQPGRIIYLTYSGVLHPYTVSTRAYDPLTGRTMVVVTAATIPANLSNEALLQEHEGADTPTTPDHGDRVYLTGLGAYEIIEFYLTKLVRAAGVVARIEHI